MSKAHLLLALSLVAVPVAAQEASTGIAADRLRPALGPSTLAGAEGAETTPYGQLGLLVALGYLRDPIVLRATADDRVVSHPVRGQLTSTLGLELGLPRRFALRVSLPAALWNDGERLRGTGVGAVGNDPGPALHAAAGDLVLGLKVALLGSPTAPGMHAALALDVSAPLGGQNEFAATRGPTVSPRVLLDYRLPWLSFVLDASVRFQSAKRLFRTRIGDELVLAGGVIARVASLGPARRCHLLAYVEGAGIVTADAGARPGELRGALRLDRAGLQVDLGGGAGLVDAIGAPRWRAFVLLRLPLGHAH